MINKQDYLVLDVETNGLNSNKDDLLSLTIYDPHSENLFNKFLPLHLNYDVYTTQFNGITKDTLKEATHLTQEEVTRLIYDFDIKNKTVLIYGNLDKPFLEAYLKRHKLKGFSAFNIFNFKSLIFSSSFRLENNITKDNLCKIFNIDGVSKTHSGISDCILEWKLFEKINNENLIVIGNNVYRFNKNYIIPASYIGLYKKLALSLTHLPKIACKSTLIKSARLHNDIIRFGSNITGVSIESKLETFFNAKKVDSTKFLSKNIQSLEYVGTLPTTVESIPVLTDNQGNLIATNEKDASLVKVINSAYAKLQEDAADMVSYIKKEIFKSEQILSQELVVNEKDNVLALCDLSNQNAVVEIKTGHKIDVNDFKYQLFYQSRERPCYMLTINWQNLTLDLLKINFVFDDEAENLIKESKNSKLKQEADELQREHFDKKNLTIIEYKGKTCNSKFKCNICNKTFAMKRNLTRETISYFLHCPYCNPQNTPERYEKLEEKDYDFHWEIQGKLGRRRILIYNWITKNEIYLKCKKCDIVWQETIKSLEACRCPSCSKRKKH